MARQSGIAVPLFSLASSHGWGIGEFGDLPEFANWMREAGQAVIQILPIQEMPPLESSPYSAMTAMAASTALPPLRSTSSPTCAARLWLVATIPCGAMTTDRPA